MELSKLRLARIQREEIEQRLAELEGEESASEHERYSAAVERLREQLWKIRRLCIEEETRLREFIERERDPQIRIILTLRFIREMSWTSIAMTIGGGNTSSGIRGRYYRWLKQQQPRR